MITPQSANIATCLYLILVRLVNHQILKEDLPPHECHFVERGLSGVGAKAVAAVAVAATSSSSSPLLKSLSEAAFLALFTGFRRGERAAVPSTLVRTLFVSVPVNGAAARFFFIFVRCLADVRNSRLF